jgi:hypothetical protein
LLQKEKKKKNNKKLQQKVVKEMNRLNEYLEKVYEETSKLGEDVHYGHDPLPPTPDAMDASPTIDDDALSAVMNDYEGLLRYVRRATKKPRRRDDVIMAIQDYAYEKAHTDLDMHTTDYIADVSVLLDLDDVEV